MWSKPDLEPLQPKELFWPSIPTEFANFSFIIFLSSEAPVRLLTRLIFSFVGIRYYRYQSNDYRIQICTSHFSDYFLNKKHKPWRICFYYLQLNYRPNIWNGLQFSVHNPFLKKQYTIQSIWTCTKWSSFTLIHKHIFLITFIHVLIP